MHYRADLELIFTSKPLEKSSHSFPFHVPSEIENFSTEEGVLASFLYSSRNYSAVICHGKVWSIKIQDVDYLCDACVRMCLILHFACTDTMVVLT